MKLTQIIFKSMIVRERLISEMNSLSAESKWEEILQETISELLEVRPNNPYLFLQKKISLKQKMDNSKNSQYLLELTMYLVHIDPLFTPEQTIRDKIISLCVEKYQHTKIKKTQIQQLVNVILFSLQQPKKEMFLKILQQMLDREIYSILEYSDILYHSLVFRGVACQIIGLQKRLAQFKIQLDRAIVNQWINTINEQNSMTKQLGLQFEDKDIFKGIATDICQKIIL